MDSAIGYISKILNARAKIVRLFSVMIIGIYNAKRHTTDIFAMSYSVCLFAYNYIIII